MDSDLMAKSLKIMVGTTRFELATSPTPRVRSTRLSHVPTVFARQPRRVTAGYVAVLSVHELCGPNPLCLVGGGYVFLGQGAAFAEEEVVHLLHEELLGFAGPGLEAVFIQKHLLALYPLAPGLFADVFEDLLAEIGVEGGFVQAFHLGFVLCAEHHMRHFFGQLLFVFYAEIFWCGRRAVLLGFLRKVVLRCGVFVVSLW